MKVEYYKKTSDTTNFVIQQYLCLLWTQQDRDRVCDRSANPVHHFNNTRVGIYVKDSDAPLVVTQYKFFTFSFKIKCGVTLTGHRKDVLRKSRHGV